jgi:uncharacterized membrane protein
MLSASASADDRLTVSGNMDFRFFMLENYSHNDRHYTKAVIGSPAVEGQRGDEDSLTWMHQRFNFRISVEAFENTKVVTQSHVDQQWGMQTYNIGVGAYSGSFVIEGYWIEGLLPGTAAKFELGVPYFAAESGGWAAANKIFNTAAPGATLSAPLSDTISTYTWFSWIGQDLDGYAGGSVPVDGVGNGGGHGDDWAAGTRATITLAEGLEADLIYAYHFTECGRAQRAAQTGCDTGALYGAGNNTAYEENRHWIGSTVRYDYADFSFSPTLILYRADDKLAGETESMLLDVRADYSVGPLSLSGRVVYTPGSDFNSDGTMRTNRDYDVIGVWGIPHATQWFTLFGNSSGNPAFNDLGPLLLGGSAQANIRHESFDLMHVAAKAEYTLTPQTSIGAAVGIFNTTEDTMGNPSSASGQFTTDTSPNFADLGVTYAGGSHLATEVDAWLHYNLYPNTTISFFIAYAMTGDALGLVHMGQTYESQDVMGAGGRFVYSF